MYHSNVDVNLKVRDYEQKVGLTQYNSNICLKHTLYIGYKKHGEVPQNPHASTTTRTD